MALPDRGPPVWRDFFTGPLASRAALILLGVWLNAADTLVTATILPSVARDLGGWAWFGWAVAGYLLGSILAGASAGHLSRRLGLKAALMVAALIYALGCALGAAAPSIAIFLVGRLAQGIGGGWIVGLCYVAIGAVIPEKLWARAFAATAGVWGVATLLGPLVGGVFAAVGHWRWAFWVFAAQGVVFAIAAFRLFPGARSGKDAGRSGLAWRTLLALGAAIGAIGAADVAPGRTWPFALVISGAALLAVAGHLNAAPGERLLPRDAANPATTAGAGYAMMLTMEASTMAFGVYGAAMLQVVVGLSPLVAGYSVGSLAVGWTVMAFIVSGQPERRHGGLIIAGAAVNVVGVALLSLTIGSGAAWPVAGAAAVVGAGFGLCWSVATRRVMSAAPPEDQAAGAAAVPTCQLIGGALGAATAGAIANLLGLAHDFTAARAVAVGPWLFAAFIPLAVLGWLAALRLAKGSAVPAPARAPQSP